MAGKKVTPEDIKQMNDLYWKYKTYAEVARQTGFSASTVAKYIDKNYEPPVIQPENEFKAEWIPPFTPTNFEGVTNYGDLCVLSDEERLEIQELWKEIAV